MRVKILLLLFLFQASVALAEPAPEITKQWYKLIEQYKEHMVVGEWNGAIQAAETLMKIDPASSEAKFYLVYAVKQTGEKYPAWVGKPSAWAYGSINDRFYAELAKQITKNGS